MQRWEFGGGWFLGVERCTHWACCEAGGRGGDGRVVKGLITTVNVSSGGPLIKYLAAGPPSSIIAVQEHHGTLSRLSSLQNQAKDLGYHGVWSAAVPSDGGGTSNGVAILTKTHISVTAAPYFDQDIAP
ncbi:unnamed protein product, partial [Prorocentrum cordatum]